MVKNTGKDKFIIVLHGIDIEKVNSKYNIRKTCDSLDVDNVDESTTRLCELAMKSGTPDPISFLDESKKLHVCNVTQIDFSSKMNVTLLRYHCYWCKHPFETMPIGCPVNYVSCQAVKKYHSHITKDKYTIKENITSGNEIQDSNITVIPQEYYETDGVFCSFNCCKAWIADNKHNRLYDKSDMLLTKMYNDVIGSDLVVINKAPHWRLLEHYGGHLNIIQFREGFFNVEYQYHGITRTLPTFISIGHMYEEKIKF